MENKKRVCPKCQSKKVVPIIYGMPTMEAVKEYEAGKLVIGGCCISDESPDWHCQDCEHEFGKYPDADYSDFLIPIKLNFSIGGFSSYTQFVRLANESLQYGKSIGAPEHGEILGTIEPSEREWRNFKKQLHDIGVWKWKKRYDNPDILDGTQWELEIEYGDQKVKSFGSNSYPDKFDELRDVFSLLLGKDNLI